MPLQQEGHFDTNAAELRV